MAMQARRAQMIIARNLIAGLTRGKPSVNFSPLGMLTCAAFSHHIGHPQPTNSSSRAPDPKYPAMRRPSRNRIGTYFGTFKPMAEA
jgi:hypothetical protein